jgi:PAS domain-containing protein
MSEEAKEAAAALETLRRHQVTFDNTWRLTIVLATMLAIVCWYLRLVQLDIAPVIWTLAGLALAQPALALLTGRSTSPSRLRWLALCTQLLGTLLLGVGWHLFGGLQQPLFPLFIILPLLPAALLLGFWQQQLALLGLLAVLASGVLLSPDTNSFMQARYGVRLGLLDLPRWLPQSRVAFADVNTSPTYELMLVITVAVIGVAVTALARSLASLFSGGGARVGRLESDLARLEQLNAQLVSHAPSAAIVVDAMSGRIIHASARFAHAFALQDPVGQFLLDAIAFHYPMVIKRLLQTGGEEIQGATLNGRELPLRVRAEVLNTGASQVTAVDVESFPEPGLRAEIDAVEDPLFAITSAGHVALPNRAAAELLGEAAEGLPAAGIFEEASPGWWQIAPLESARRILRRGSQSYLVSMRRKRIVPSIGELTFVRLQPTAAA